jgi:hypothetical protein
MGLTVEQLLDRACVEQCDAPFLQLGFLRAGQALANVVSQRTELAFKLANQQRQLVRLVPAARPS